MILLKSSKQRIECRESLFRRLPDFDSLILWTLTVTILMLSQFFWIGAALAEIDCRPLQPPAIDRATSPTKETSNTEITGAITVEIQGVMRKILGGAGEVEGILKQSKEKIYGDFPNLDQAYLEQNYIYVFCQIIKDSNMSESEKLDGLIRLKTSKQSNLGTSNLTGTLFLSKPIINADIINFELKNLSAIGASDVQGSISFSAKIVDPISPDQVKDIMEDMTKREFIITDLDPPTGRYCFRIRADVPAGCSIDISTGPDGEAYDLDQINNQRYAPVVLSDELYAISDSTDFKCNFIGPEEKIAIHVRLFSFQKTSTSLACPSLAFLHRSDSTMAVTSAGASVRSSNSRSLSCDVNTQCNYK